MNLSDKNTKKELLEGIAALTKKYEAAISGNMSPETVIQQTGKEELKDEVEKFVDTTPISFIESLFNKNVSDFRDAIANYYKLQDAIKLADEELQDYYNIKREANTLLAILEAKKEAILNLENDKAEVYKNWEEKISELSAKFEQESKDIIAKREKDKKEYDYEQERKEKLDTDKLKDKLALEKKKHDEELEAEKKQLQKDQDDFAKRETELIDREDKISDMEQTIKELESYKDKYRDEIIKGNSAKKDHEHALALMKSDYDNKLLSKDHQIASCQLTIDQQNDTINKLTDKLDNAYNNVKEVAANAVNGAVQGSMINTLKDVATNKDNKLGK